MEKKRLRDRARRAAETPEMREARLEKRRQQARAKNAIKTAEERNALLDKRRQQARQRDLVPGNSANTPAEREIKRGVAADCWNIFVLQTQQKIEQEIEERQILEAGGTIDKAAREHEALYLKW